MISSGIGWEVFYAFIYSFTSSFTSSFFSALDTDFPPLIALFLGSSLTGGCFFTGAGDGTEGGGFLSIGLPLLTAGLLTAEVA